MPTVTPAEQNLVLKTNIASHADRSRRQLLRASMALATLSSLSVARMGFAQELAFDEQAPLKPRHGAPDSSTDLSLDGQGYKGPTGAKDMQAHHDEVIRFENGKMSSSKCERWGFEPGKYQVTQYQPPE